MLVNVKKRYEKGLFLLLYMPIPKYKLVPYIHNINISVYNLHVINVVGDSTVRRPEKCKINTMNLNIRCEM